MLPCLERKMGRHTELLKAAKDNNFTKMLELFTNKNAGKGAKFWCVCGCVCVCTPSLRLSSLLHCGALGCLALDSA